MGNGVVPGLADVLNLATHADAVDLAVCGQDAHGDRNVKLVAFAVGDVVEQKGFAIGLGNAAPELPSHQGMHLGVFVDFALDFDQKTGFVQGCQMVMQVRVAAQVLVLGVGGQAGTCLARLGTFSARDTFCAFCDFGR